MGRPIIILFLTMQWNTDIKLFSISSERWVYFTVHSLGSIYGLIVHEINEVNIILMIVIMSVLGLDSGYTVKYNP